MLNHGHANTPDRDVDLVFSAVLLNVFCKLSIMLKQKYLKTCAVVPKYVTCVFLQSMQS